MFCGETPTISLQCPFVCTCVEKASISFGQEKVLILQKELHDCQIDGDTISVTLTQEETAMFDPEKHVVDIQLSIVIRGRRAISDIIRVPIKYCYRGEVL